MFVGEEEYVQYLAWKNPKIISSVTSNGIPNIKGRGCPDAIDTEAMIAYFMHGCFVSR